MQYLTVTLALATVVSAIDIRFYGIGAKSCDNASFGCANYNPDRCCTLLGFAGRVGWHAVPREWTIRLFWGPNDKSGYVCLRNRETRGGMTDYCFRAFINGDPAEEISGAGYRFNLGPPWRARDLDSSPCQAQRADTFFAADGTKYDITALDDAQLKEMMELVDNSTATADFLEIFPAITLRK